MKSKRSPRSFTFSSSSKLTLLLAGMLLVMIVIAYIAKQANTPSPEMAKGIRYLFSVPAVSKQSLSMDTKGLAVWPSEYQAHVHYALAFLQDFSQAVGDPRGARMKTIQFIPLNTTHRRQMIHGEGAAAMYMGGENVLALDYNELANGAVAFFPTVDKLYHELGHACFDDQPLRGDMEDPKKRVEVFQSEASNYARDEQGLIKMGQYIATLPGIDGQTLGKWQAVLRYLQHQAKRKHLVFMIKLDSLRFGLELIPSFEAAQKDPSITPARFNEINQQMFALTFFNVLPDHQVAMGHAVELQRILGTVQTVLSPEITIPAETVRWIPEWQQRVIELQAALQAENQAEENLSILQMP